MGFVLIIIFLIIIVFILKFFFGCSKKELELIGKNNHLDKLAKKYPSNIEICREYLQILNNKEVTVEEDKNAKTSLYIAISNKILIADVKDSFTRIQTIAHECIHSIQNRKILLLNFIYSNIYIIFFITISILKLIKVLPYDMMFVAILSICGMIYLFIRLYLENDAMIKARFLAKEYMEAKSISSKNEIEEVLKQFDRLNDVGIRMVNYSLFKGVAINIAIFCIICIIDYI